MRYIAAYLLLQTGGNAHPKAADIKKVLSAGGVEVDEERLTKFLSEVDGKSIDELVAAGSSKLSSVGDRERLRRPLIGNTFGEGCQLTENLGFFPRSLRGCVATHPCRVCTAYRFRLEVPRWRRAEVQPLEVVLPLPKPPRRRRRRKKPRVSPGGSIFARRRIGRRES